MTNRTGLGTPKQVAEYLHTTVQSLANDRYMGRGIPYVKFGRRVLYSWEAVDAYMAEHTIKTEKSVVA